MPMRPNPDLMADIAEIAVRAERLFLRCQFDAESPQEVEWAQSGLRHARGLGKVVTEFTARGAAPAAKS
jgi:hypothetical protein